MTDPLDIVWNEADHAAFSAAFDDLPERPCSMARQLTVMLGTLSAAGAVGVLLAVAAWRGLVERR